MTAARKWRSDEDSDETPRLIEDAEVFEGNDTYVHFIVRPFDVAAEKADEILNNTLARIKRHDKGPSTGSEIATWSC